MRCGSRSSAPTSGSAPGHILLALLRAEAGTVPRALKEAGVDRAELNDRVAAAKLG